MNYNMWMFPWMLNRQPIPDDYNIPPTIYSILNSYVNFENPNPVAIKNLAKEGRGIIFDFDYPIAEGVTKEEFECMVLNHFMMRRIGYETMTAFKLALNVKLNEIMPMYIKLFHAINGWEIFLDGEVTTREQIDSRTTSNNTQSNTSNTDNSETTLVNTTNSQNTSDRRFSDTPQNQLSDVRSGEYVSQYNYDTDSGNATSNSTNTLSATNNSTLNETKSSTDNGNINETIRRSPADKMSNYIQFVKEKQNIYTMIFKDLDSLFYQVI